MIDRAAIEARRTELLAQRDDAVAQVNAVLGAIQDCDYWLTRLDASDVEGDVEDGHPIPLHAAASS